MMTPQDGQRGVLGAQHGLTRLVETIEALRRGQQQQQARDTTMQETRTRLAQQVGRVTRWSRHLHIAVGTLGGLSVLLAGLVGWQGLAGTSARVCAGAGGRRWCLGAALGASAQARAGPADRGL
jgi:ABC-type cobalamin transport system permease subunit